LDYIFISNMKLAFIGSGYVGLTTGACFASLGHHVICQDIDEQKIKKLKKGECTIFEPDLEELLGNGIASGNLEFTTDIERTIKESEIIFICVNTPPKEDGHADLKFVEMVARDIARNLNGYKIIVDKSTVPIRTAEKVKETIERYSNKKMEFDVVSNPEFLREGNAVFDILNPDRVVIGAENERSKNIMIKLYESLIKNKKIFVKITSVKSAELIKHGANTFLSAKISFANLIAEVCENAGADASEVLEAIGLDERIGKQFLRPGIGFGGSCFPKDINAFKKTLEVFGVDHSFIDAIENINNKAVERFIKKIEKTLWVLDGKSLCVLGLSFKPDTDDIRNSPALKIIQYLKNNGVKIHAHDPKAMPKVRVVFPEVSFFENPYDAASGCEALIVCTEWEEYKNLDLKKLYSLMVTPIIFDGRNIFSEKKAKKIGFGYFGVGK